MNAPDVRSALGDVVDPEILSVDDPDRMAHANDWTPAALLAARRGRVSDWVDCVVRPRSAPEVADVLRWAGATGTAIVPFGGGSSVCGGIADPGRPAVVLDLTSMSQIVDVDTTSRLARVQAGVTGPQLAAALSELGWRTGHEPQSVEISTVGGWVATRACGQLSARFGGIEDILTGLEAVLPDGSIVRSKTVPRRSAGPDVARMMVGSEGALGVVTEATLRISPEPALRADRCVRFDHMAEGVAACRAIAQSELAPTLVRLYDADDASFFLRGHPEEPPGPLLLLSFEEEGAEDRADRAVALEASARRGPDELVAHWWAHRNDAVAEYRRVMAGDGILGPYGVVETMEVSASWSRLRDLYHAMKTVLGEKADLVGCHLSHVYPDGACLYFTIASACEDDEEAADRLDGWWTAGMATCLERGGSVSHHHGIGRLKAPWLEAELEGWLKVLRALKSVVDPAGVMNPGVLGL